MKPKIIGVYEVPRTLHWALCNLDEEYWNTYELNRPVGMWVRKDLQMPLPFVDIIALGVLYYYKKINYKFHKIKKIKVKK